MLQKGIVKVSMKKGELQFDVKRQGGRVSKAKTPAKAAPKKEKQAVAA
jgi:hypothetical protein